jgi:glycosyltransferase involved in cell wall biosynthesis
MYNNKDLELVLVGGGDYDSEIRKLAAKHSSWLKLFDRTESVEVLKAFYEEADILMPSKYETFGLVYKAMSQGLPIFSKVKVLMVFLKLERLDFQSSLVILRT